MNLVSIDNISKALGNKKLFQNVSFGIDDNQKIALIGINGCGKTTFLRIIAGLETVDNGKITNNKTLHITYLEQITRFNPDDTILQHIFNFNNPLGVLIKKYEELCVKIAKKGSKNDEKKLHDIMEEMDKNNAWEYEHKIKSILTVLEIDDLSLLMKNLSGGMIKKVALAQVLISEVDLIIMDEPTNHLDLKTITFVEDFLFKTNKSILLVTHDRYFLDKICNTIIEIDKNQIYKFNGNYSYYLEKKTEIENSLLKDDQKTEGLLRKELEWYKRQPKARTTKSKIRMESIESMMSREKLKKDKDVELSISGRRLGKKILELNEISKSFDSKTVIKPFSIVFKRKAKIGIVGPNGSGKTTLLNIITGKINPDTGTIDKGLNTSFGYFTQSRENFDPDMRVIDYVKETAEYITLNNGSMITASKMLERFLFMSSAQYNTISNLSGGEKRRLYLLKILMANPNFLLLDEPTNDLDIKTLSVLENFLIEFEGCLIVVTHDRYFMNRVVDSLLIFDEEGNITGFPGNYSDYLTYKENIDTGSSLKSDVKQKDNRQKETGEKKKLSFKEKKELEEIEKEVDTLETEKKELEIKLSGKVYDPENIQTWNKRYTEIETTLKELLKRWEYLAGFEG